MRKSFIRSWDGGSTQISHSITASGLSSSRRPAPGASVQFGKKITSRCARLSAQGLYLIVSDVEAARKDLVARGIEASDVCSGPGTPGAQFRSDGSGRVSGPAPEHATHNSFATFRDPDGNGWLLQEVTRAAAWTRNLVIWMSRR